jgi:hypothetical protein
MTWTSSSRGAIRLRDLSLRGAKRRSNPQERLTGLEINTLEIASSEATYGRLTRNDKYG